MTALGRHLLAIDDLSVRLPLQGGALRAVERVSLALERGKTLAIVGGSGCGKSMLCRSIMGILPAHATVRGRVVFNGRDLVGLPRRELNVIRGREIGIVLQDPMSSLNPVMRIGRQIAEPMRRHLGISAGRARERSLELLAAVGIPLPAERIDCYPHHLSGGMRQRVAIAIALACEPQLLIADEPTTSLDVTVQAEILNLLGRLQKERNMAMILVSHDLGLVAGRSHETAVMYAGRIVEHAVTSALFAGMRMPYTQALFDAVPNLDDPPHTALKAIGGQPPDLSALFAGCPFAPRCRRAEKRCREEAPPLAGDDGGEHRFACWFPCK